MMETTNDDAQLRVTIHHLTEENKRKDVRLEGLENLGKLLHEKEEECEALRSEADSLRTALERSESRIVQLNQMTGAGPQIGFGKGFIRPGVSRKVLEALAKDNAKYRDALEHITELGPRGPDVTVRVKHLHDHALQLQNNIRGLEAQIKELETSLNAVQSEDMQHLALQVKKLSEEMNRKDKDARAKQAFYQNVMLQYEAMRNLLEEFEGTSGVRRREDQGTEACSRTDGVDGPYTIQELKAELDKIQLASTEEDSYKKSHEELENTRKRMEELESQLKIAEERNKELLEQLKSAQECGQDYHTQFTSMLDEFDKGKSREEHLKRAFKNKCDELEEMKMEQSLMQEQLKYFENDFKRQVSEYNEMRQKFMDSQRLEKHAKQEMEQIKAAAGRQKMEYESTKSAMKYFEDRCLKLEADVKKLQEEKRIEQERNAAKPYYPPRSCGDTMYMQDQRKLQSVGARGGRGDLESDGRPEIFRTDSSSSPSPVSLPADDYIECPHCGKVTREFEAHYMQAHGPQHLFSSVSEPPYADMIPCSVCHQWVRINDLERHVKEHTRIPRD